MVQKSRTVAIIGSALIALLLTGFDRNTATSPLTKDSAAEAALKPLSAQAAVLYRAGRYLEARDIFRTIAANAQKAGLHKVTAMNWSNAGTSSLLAMQFSEAKAEFAKARVCAETTHQYVPLAFAMNSLASLYIQTGQPENAVRVALEALDGPAGHADAGMRAKLLYQVGFAKLELNQFEAARPYYAAAIDGFLDRQDLDSAARAWGAIGGEFLRVNRLAEAESALREGLLLIRVHRLNSGATVLAGLARLKSAQGDNRSAAALFDSALAAPPGVNPGYMLYAYRGFFRLKTGDLNGALADFRESRRIVIRMRADMVPADQDRVDLERGLNLVYEGLVAAGNRLAAQSGDKATLRETFDAAEQDRLWSLRALIPSAEDWRKKLPARYWEILARYQSLQRTAVVKSTPEVEKRTGELSLQLQQIEAEAAGGAGRPEGGSPLAHLKKALDSDTVILSFHVSETSSWVWAVDRNRMEAFALPPAAELQKKIAEFGKQLSAGTNPAATGAELYRDLFGRVPAFYLRHKRWLLELDGPLYDLPFSALVADDSDRANPVYLIERAELQSLPGALLAERDAIPNTGEFLGVGDPVYNAADLRYTTKGNSPSLVLARLPNTSEEIRACSRAWGGASAKLLTGPEARVESLRAALESNPAIIHFATHVVAEPGEFRSGLIALSLNRSGEMGLLGPREIVARPVKAKLVVLDGCHSARGEALPSAGLMGLTRAWIGAGAMAVLATHWDVPDETAQVFMTDFYASLHADSRRGAASAVRVAQVAALKRPQARQKPSSWAGYFLLSRML